MLLRVRKLSRGWEVVEVFPLPLPPFRVTFHETWSKPPPSPSLNLLLKSTFSLASTQDETQHCYVLCLCFHKSFHRFNCLGFTCLIFTLLTAFCIRLWLFLKGFINTVNKMSWVKKSTLHIVPSSLSPVAGWFGCPGWCDGRCQRYRVDRQSPAGRPWSGMWCWGWEVCQKLSSRPARSTWVPVAPRPEVSDGKDAQKEKHWGLLMSYFLRGRHEGITLKQLCKKYHVQ